MVALDQTRLLMAGVILGFVLAVALIRPQIFPHEEGSERLAATKLPSEQRLNERSALSHQELVDWQGELESRETALNQRDMQLEEHDNRLDQRQSRLETREASLIKGENRLREREANLIEGENQLKEREAELNHREAAIEQRKSAVNELASQLQDEKEDLARQFAAMGRKEALLAEQEQRLTGWRRLSIAAVILVGLLAVPSIFVLVALVENRHGGNRALRSLDQELNQHRRVLHGEGSVGWVAVPSVEDNGHGQRTRHRAQAI